MTQPDRHQPPRLDTAALTAPVDRGELSAYRATLPDMLRPTARALWPFVALVVMSLVFAAMWTWFMLDDRSTPLGLSDGAVLAIGWAFPVVMVAVLVVAVRRRTGVKQFRLSRLAEDNGFVYYPLSITLPWPGLIFGGGKGEALTYDLVRVSSRGPVMGNHSLTTGTGRGRHTERWGFATAKLGAELPHIVLDARGNNSLLGTSTLPVPFQSAQRLDLEGDFSEHFLLYCPRGYERDALYLFTPDIMARFVDHAAELDVEIVDGRLFLYSRRDLVTLDPATWEWILTTFAAVTEKVKQWQRWRDERLGDTTVDTSGDAPRIVRPPAGVAEPGRRLQQRVQWVGIALGILGLGWIVVTALADVFGWW